MQSPSSAAQSRAPAYAQAMAARNLQLLQAIESTLDGLRSDTGLMETIATGFTELQEKLEKAALTAPIDPAGAVCRSLDLASQVCVRLHQRAKRGHQAAYEDPRLKMDDGVAEEYGRLIRTVEQLHDAIERLREWVATHDALLEPVKEGEFSSVNDLFKAIGVNL